MARSAHTRRALLLSFSVLVLAACGQATESNALPTNAGGTAGPITTDLQATEVATGSTVVASSTPAPSTPTATSTSTPEPTATEDTRLPPEDWRSWPVVPTLSPWLREVYQRGLEAGNDPHHFSKVGDCQIIPTVFLGCYDDTSVGICPLGDEYADLQETIDYFAGSFIRRGFSLAGGFNFPAVFSPLRADPDNCMMGETPLECEFRTHRPSIVFIAMEAWYSGRTVETHEEYLRRTLDYALAKGTIPIVATKADNVEGDDSINLTTARVAYEYDIPLWNFWLSVQDLPRHGIDWSKGTQGFHTTVAAWEMRSFTGLQTLDALWRAVRDLAPVE